jgi:hypothetical protein
MNPMKLNIPRKRVTKLSPMKMMRLAKASKELEGMDFDQMRSLTPDERASWDRAKRGPGRPRKAAADKAARVLVTIAPTLLAEADGYARRQGISRAELVARGLVAVLAKDRGNRKTG